MSAGPVCLENTLAENDYSTAKRWAKKVWQGGTIKGIGLTEQ